MKRILYAIRWIFSYGCLIEWVLRDFEFRSPIPSCHSHPLTTYLPQYVFNPRLPLLMERILYSIDSHFAFPSHFSVPSGPVPWLLNPPTILTRPNSPHLSLLLAPQKVLPMKNHCQSSSSRFYWAV